MGRPKNIVKSIPLNLSLDADVAAKLKLALYSELEGKIPHGAQSSLINHVLRKYFRSEAGKQRYHASQAALENPELIKKVDDDLTAFLQSPADEKHL